MSVHSPLHVWHVVDDMWVLRLHASTCLLCLFCASSCIRFGLSSFSLPFSLVLCGLTSSVAPALDFVGR